MGHHLHPISQGLRLTMKPLTQDDVGPIRHSLDLCNPQYRSPANILSFIEDPGPRFLVLLLEAPGVQHV